jgi:hypothetical protein
MVVETQPLKREAESPSGLNPVIVVRLSPEGIAAFEQYRESESRTAGFLLSRNAVARKILEKELVSHGDLAASSRPKQVRAGALKRRIQDLERDVAALRSVLEKKRTEVWFE